MTTGDRNLKLVYSPRYQENPMSNLLLNTARLLDTLLKVYIRIINSGKLTGLYFPDMLLNYDSV